MDIEGITATIILEEAEVGLETDNIQVILEGMTEVVAVGQDQVQEPVLTETELDASSVGNMIILIKTVQLHKWNKSHNKIQQMYNLDEEQTAL